MERLPTRKVSLMGLVLLGASAVTAAILPSKNEDSLRAGNGVLHQNSFSCSGNEQLTCITASTGQNCFDTETGLSLSTATSETGDCTSATNGSGNTTING